MKLSDFTSATHGSPATLDVLKTWQRIVTRNIKESPLDLSARQMGILLTVYLSSPPHTIRSLAENLGISKPAVCRAIDMLSSQELLKRKRDEDDKRNVFIQRTINGSVFLSDYADIIMQEVGIKEEGATESTQSTTKIQREVA